MHLRAWLLIHGTQESVAIETLTHALAAKTNAGHTETKRGSDISRTGMKSTPTQQALHHPAAHKKGLGRHITAF